MKRPASRYQFALLLALLALCGFSIYAHRALENGRDARADHLQPARPAATKPPLPVNEQSTPSANTEGAAATEASAPAQTSAIAKSVIAGGGGESASGALNVKGTSGQPVVGTSSGGTFTLRSGFWTTPANNCSGVTITFNPPTLPNGRVGEPYNQPLTVTGGAAPYTLSFVSGILPTGTRVIDGVLTGTPVQAAVYQFKLRATDANGCVGDSPAYTIIISCPATISFTPLALPSGTANAPYSQQLTATGGFGAVTWSITSGSLPTGISLSPSGLLAGTTAQPGNFPFTARATFGSDGCFGERSYTLPINPVTPSCSGVTISIAPTTLPSATQGQLINQSFIASGGTPPYTFRLEAGVLPTGVSLLSGGALTGIPMASGTFNFTAKAIDANLCEGAQSYTLKVNPPVCPTITIGPETLPPATQGAAYNQPLTATNGIGSSLFTFSITAGALPNGLSLLNGISGTPTVAGTFNFTIAATDPNSCTGSRAYTLIVNPPTTVRVVRIVPANGSPGGTVVVPIELASQGDENAVGLSITFDTSVLSNPLPALGGDATGALSNFSLGQAAAGRVGLSLALPSGQAFAAGARHIFTVTFTIAGGAAANTTDINFGNQPIAREIANAAAAVLPAGYTGGAVTITRGFEADVQPRPDGNGAVTVSDWVQVGRFAAGTDTAANGGEFQRADCAPRDARGDGRISISDWVQAGRYAAGLDELVPAGGPTAPSNLLPEIGGEVLTHGNAMTTDAAQTRTVRAVSVAGAGGNVSLMLNALGNENALGFSLLFNPSEWRFVSAANGSDAPDALLNTNTGQTARGRLGVALALPANRTLAAGARQLAVLTFEPVTTSGVPAPVLAFGDAPVSREVVAANAQTLTASFAVELNGGTASLLASVSAASFRDGDVAREQVVAAFGTTLATAVAVADTLPLPTELADVHIAVTDSRGAARNAPLFFVSPTQINYQLPAGTADGVATVAVTRGGGVFSIGLVSAGAVAPALFTADASGTGLPAATLLRVNAAGVLGYEPVARFDPVTSRIVAVPINLGAETDQVFLVLYGTGVRGRSNLSAVACTVSGVAAEVNYAGEAAGFAGLDQINVRLPRALAGRGDVDVALRVDGKAANAVRLNIR